MSLRQVTGTISAGIEITSLTKRAESSLEAHVNYSPIQSELRTLFNPYQNYQFFIVSSLLPAMLQMFVMIWTAYVVGKELQANTWSQYLSAGTSIYSLLAAKVLPVFIIASVIAFACIFWLFGISGWPVNGSLSLLILGWELMILAYIVLGFLFTSIASNLATGLSFTIFFTAPAFAYVGITFPQHAMPLIAQIWTYILPVRSLLRLQVEQVEMGAPVVNSLPEILILLCFVLFPLPFVIAQIRRRCKTQKVGC
jgi:ABC-2 type transport system permease protein